MAEVGTFRPVELLELALTADGRPTLEDFRPRRHRRLDSADYPGFLPPLVVPFSRVFKRRQSQMTLWDE